MLKKTPLKNKGYTLKKSNPLSSSYKGLKRGGFLKKCAKSEEKLAQDKLKKEKRTQFFLECWENLPRESEISGKKFYSPNRTYYHHCFPKSNYTEIEFCFDIILRVTEDEHTMVEANLEIFPENVKKREWVVENWEYCKQQSKLWEENYEKQIKNEN